MRHPIRFRFAALALATACSASADPPPNAGGTPPPGLDMDSIVLERTLCFGTCPAYRLRIARDGAVHFESRNPNDDRVATDTVGTEGFQWLVAEAERIGFHELPDDINESDELCPVVATDAPTHVMTLFGERTKRVSHYVGCITMNQDSARRPAALIALVQFANAIDSVAGAGQWIRPARGRGAH